MSDWVTRYYDDVDHMRMEEFLAWHTPDVRVRFANHPPATGHDEVRGAIGHFWGEINGLRHKIENVWEQDGTTIVEAAIDYTRKDDRVVEIPCTTILHRTGEMIDQVRIYLDVAPVFAPAEETAAA